MNRFSTFSILFSFKPRTIYVANHHLQEIRHKSSSGGAFYAIASYVLSQNGIVIGAAYRGADVEHIAISDKSELWKLQKSKYAPSSLKNINMDNLLALGKLVMFSGTPCQVKGIAKDIFGTYNNYVISAQSISTDSDLISAFKWLYDNETDIRRHLKMFMPGYCNRANKIKEALLSITQ